MKIIQLTQGKVALVDDADYQWLNQYKWFAFNTRGMFYAARRVMLKKKVQRTVFMHRDILGLVAGDGIIGDHKDLNTLNNQRNNLRKATKSQNCTNTNSRKNSSSKYLGVSYFTSKKSYGTYQYIYAQIRINGVSVKLGKFNTEEEAAKAYDRKALEIHGEFANLNFK